MRYTVKAQNNQRIIEAEVWADSIDDAQKIVERLHSTKFNSYIIQRIK
jgi:hypothetical protein